MDHDTDVVTGTYSDEPRLALLTVTEARETVELLQVLERLDLDEHGQAAGSSPPTSPVACPLRSRSRCATADTDGGRSLRNPSASDRPHLVVRVQHMSLRPADS
ncbi:hypothetical protein [Streptomyces sp. NPDC047981]|uniref:hypothetical protein n=1 Tax=Streptomyces sp. NPDC047981 TaxID=3154610 RepID=UPI00341C83EF